MTIELIECVFSWFFINRIALMCKKWVYLYCKMTFTLWNQVTNAVFSGVKYGRH